MTIGTPMNMSSGYRVSHDHHLVRSYLVMAKRRGHYSGWKASPISLAPGITILRKHYCSFLYDWLSLPTNNLRIDGISAIVAPSTRRIVKRILPTDEWIDREGCREGY